VKASYRWLQALVPGLTASAEEVAARLTGAGLEVEGLQEFGAGTEDVVVAEVVAVEPHPSRAGLCLVTVDRGGGALQRVVCGAPNVPAPGGLVALAPLGATLPAVGMTLTPRAIGGVVSEGMLCSEQELGLTLAERRAKAAGGDGAAHDEADPGILVLEPGRAKAGQRLRDAVPAAYDVIFELGVTPNRPDALGHRGLARELAALYGLAFAPAAPRPPRRLAPGAVGDAVRVVVEDPERCPHYGAALVVDVAVGPSPDWVRYRLESLGVRAISNIVDVTNLILLEFGHPLHAFDLDRVRGGVIRARRARAGEVLVTLDGATRALDPDDLVIADGEGPVALAGVMGGAGSEITATTSRVLIECAYFWPRGVRRSARRHGLHTESSHRFERGVDPGDITAALDEAATLMTELGAGARVPGELMAGAALQAPAPIVLRQARLTAVLGMRVPLAEAAATLRRLGCALLAESPDALTVEPPTHRPDLTLEVDLIEEVLRVRGLDAVPTALPAIAVQPPRTTGALSARARRAAIELGLSEAILYGFTSPRELVALGLPPATVTLLNPLTEERSVMRTSLLPGLLEALGRARRRGVVDVRLFAMGARFLPREPAAVADPDAALPDEVPSLAFVVAGSRRAELTRPVEVDVYDAKGLALEAVHRIVGREADVAHQPAERRAPYLHPRAAADVLVDGRVVGALGVLHPDVVDALDLGGSSVVVELDLRALAALGARLPVFKPIPTLPAATRDLALVVHDDVTAGAVASAIREVGAELCESVELFDLFRGAAIPAEHRSLAYHVVYRDPKAATEPEAARTLTDAEVDARHGAVVDAVKRRFGAVLRG
jgi:phenylalanyl-tRNA synthetase beta chain